MNSTRPQTIGYSLADSPVGLAAWFYEKFAAWTDTDGEPERALTKDEMLDDITCYYLRGHSYVRLGVTTCQTPPTPSPVVWPGPVSPV